MPIICTDCEEKDHEIYQLKSRLSELDSLLRKVRVTIGAAAASASTHTLREARARVYRKIEDVLAPRRS